MDALIGRNRAGRVTRCGLSPSFGPENLGIGRKLLGDLGRRGHCTPPILTRELQIDEGNSGRRITWPGSAGAADVICRFRPIPLCGRDFSEAE